MSDRFQLGVEAAARLVESKARFYHSGVEVAREAGNERLKEIAAGRAWLMDDLAAAIRSIHAPEEPASEPDSIARLQAWLTAGPMARHVDDLLADRDGRLWVRLVEVGACDVDDFDGGGATIAEALAVALERAAVSPPAEQKRT